MLRKLSYSIALSVAAAATAHAEGLVSKQGQTSLNRVDDDFGQVDTFSGAITGVYETGPFEIYSSLSAYRIEDNFFSEDVFAGSIGGNYDFGGFGVGAEIGKVSADGDGNEFGSLYFLYRFAQIVAGIGVTADNENSEEIYSAFASYEVSETDIIGGSYYAGPDNTDYENLVSLRRV